MEQVKDLKRFSYSLLYKRTEDSFLLYTLNGKYVGSIKFFINKENMTIKYYNFNKINEYDDVLGLCEIIGQIIASSIVLQMNDLYILWKKLYDTLYRLVVSFLSLLCRRNTLLINYRKDMIRFGNNKLYYWRSIRLF